MSLGTRGWFLRLVAIVVDVLLIGIAFTSASADDRTRTSGTAATVARQPSAISASGPQPSPVDRPSPGSVFVVGDSLTVGTEPFLAADVRDRGWRLAGVDARIGRPVAEGLQILSARRASLPHTVVIALGTNDLSADRATVTSWLESARAILGQRRIIWVNLCLAAGLAPWLGAYRSINASLEAIAPRYGIDVANWCAYAHARGLTPGPDHIHYTLAGYRQRAWFYAAEIAGVIRGRRGLAS